MSNIAFITTNHEWGGSEVLWSEAAIHLSKQGESVTVGIPSWSVPFNKRIIEIQMIATNFYYNCDNREFICVERKLLLYKKIFNRFIPQTYQIKPTIDKIKNKDFIFYKSKPDIVVFSLGNQWGIDDAMLYCIDNHIPYVLVFQLINEYEFIYDYTLLAKIRIICQKANKTYFVSKKNAEIFEQRIGITLYNKEFVFNPNNLTLNNFIEYPTVEPTYNVACVANLMMLHKGHDILFSIFEKKKWRERNIKLNLYGTGIHEEFLLEWKQREKLDNIEFHGFYIDIEFIWANNHALVLCTRMEGQPLCLVEAMKMRRMAIITDKGGIKDLVEDGITGFLSSDANTILFEQTLERAWNNREHWKEIGENAFLKVNNVIPENPIVFFANKILTEV